MNKALPILLIALALAGCTRQPVEDPAVGLLRAMLKQVPASEAIFIDPAYQAYLPKDVTPVPLPTEFLPQTEIAPGVPAARVLIPRVPDLYAAQVRYLLLPSDAEKWILGCSVQLWRMLEQVDGPPATGLTLWRHLDDPPLRAPGKLALTPLLGLPDRSVALEKTEVTFAQFADFLNEARPAPHVVAEWFDLARPENPVLRREEGFVVCAACADHPVAFVSFAGAQAYCAHLKRRLPTTEEWSHFAGGTERTYPWGDQDDVSARANINGEQDGFAHSSPVGSFPQGVGPYGHLDLGGNAYEWTQGETGPALRGGSFVTDEIWVRNERQESNLPYARNNHNGFRCAQ